VGDDDDGAAGLAVGVELAKDFGGVVGVEVAGGFVGEDDVGLFDEGAGEGDALAFAGAEAGGEVIGAVLEAEAFEEVGDGVGAWGVTHLGWETDADVVVDGEVGEEMKELEDEADGLGTE
jgi:hypothetical protein